MTILPMSSTSRLLSMLPAVNWLTACDFLPAPLPEGPRN
jgi:hypothetical protein